MPNWNGKWSGGRTYVTKDGRTVYVIQKDVHGSTRTIALDARNEAEALSELALFNRDRAAYLTKAQAQVQAAEVKAREKAEAALVHPTAVAEFLAYLTAPDDEKPPRSASYVQSTGQYLGGWADILRGRDLRSLKLADLQKGLSQPVRKQERKGRPPAPPKPMPRKKAIIAIKSFASWLESRGRLEPAQNPTRGLKVPAARRSAAPKGYSLELIEATYGALSSPAESKTRPFRPGTAQAVRDVYQLAARHGLHYSEIERIAAGAPIRVIDADAEIAAVVEFRHKNGDRHVMSLTPEGLRAATRLQKLGAAPVESVARKYLASAAKTLGHSQRLKLGQLRHSFATLRALGKVVYPVGQGASLELVAQILGHKSTSTTRRFYDNTEIPPLIRLPLRLVHPDDPPAETSSAA